MIIQGIKVIDLAMCGEDEIKKYIAYVQGRVDGALNELKIEPDGAGYVRLSYVVLKRKFERIRRITGKPIRIARKVV